VFGGFDPSGIPDASFLERRRWQSLIAAVGLVGGSLGGAFYLASLETEAVVQEEIITAEIQNLELEEELEEDEPVEPPPPEPPPPSNKPVKATSKPTPQPEIQNPDSVDPNPEEGEINSEGPGYGEGGSGSNDQGGKPQAKPEPKPEPKPEVKPEPPKPKPKGDKFPYDPDKPIERPPEATVPKQIGGNPPVYPPELRSRNITGKVKVRLTIYKDGTVKAAKVLAKENSAEDPELNEKANKLLLKAVAAAVQTWTFKPSTVQGKPISVFLTVTIPFTLK
jgi:periplasmic protein TonB